MGLLKGTGLVKEIQLRNTKSSFPYTSVWHLDPGQCLL